MGVHIVDRYWIYTFNLGTALGSSIQRGHATDCLYRPAAADDSRMPPSKAKGNKPIVERIEANHQRTNRESGPTENDDARRRCHSLISSVWLP